MDWDFFDIFGAVVDIVELLGDNSSSNLSYEKPKIKKKTKYFPEKISAVFLVIASALLFFVFKDPLPAENYVQTMVVASIIGLAIALILFFFLYVIEIYYFKSVFQWLFFSCSTILFFVSIVFAVYFKSGLFI